MSVTYRKELVVECESCATSIILDQIDLPSVPLRLINVQRLRAKARRLGWKLDGDSAYCPAHVDRRKD